MSVVSIVYSHPHLSRKQPAPTGPIDNCCYVDRHCQSDLEWMGGWHAFQNGQCAAPAQPQPATPAQPVVGAPAYVDNCCYVDRHCQSDLDWMAGWHAFQHGQCASPAQPAVSALTTGGNCCNLGWNCPTEVERTQGYLGLSDESVRRSAAVCRGHTYGTRVPDRGFGSICATH